MPNLDWNGLISFAPLTNPILTMAIDMKTRAGWSIASVAPAWYLGGKLEVGTGAA